MGTCSARAILISSPQQQLIKERRAQGATAAEAKRAATRESRAADKEKRKRQPPEVRAPVGGG
eukprot:scaffold3725_cov129-Isochrysis_galbana.AAC.3